MTLLEGREAIIREGGTTLITLRGFTLMEALVVIALAGLIILVSLPAITRVLRAYNVTTSAGQISLDIRFVRNACVRNKYPYRISFKDKNAVSNPNTYLIQSDTDMNGSFETLTLKTLDDSILIDPAGTNIDEIEFSTRGAVTDTAGTPVSAPFNIQIEHITNSEMKERISITSIGGVTASKIGSW